MPMVGTRRFPYTPSGIAAAKRHGRKSGQRVKMNRGYTGVDRAAEPYRPVGRPKVAPMYQTAGAQNSRSQYTGAKRAPRGVSSSRGAQNTGYQGHNARVTDSTQISNGYKAPGKAHGYFAAGQHGMGSKKTTYGKRNNSAMSRY